MQSLLWDEWRERHPEIPVIDVGYEAVLDDPRAICNMLGLVLGRGNWDRAALVVDPKLNRCGRPAS